MTEQFNVGDTVHTRNPSTRGNGRWGTAEIARVARKYVYVRIYGREVPFDKVTGREHVPSNVTNNYPRRIFTDEMKAAFERETGVRNRLQNEHRLYDIFRGGYSLDTLEQVLALLDADKAARA